MGSYYTLVPKTQWYPSFIFPYPLLYIFWIVLKGVQAYVNYVRSKYEKQFQKLRWL